MNGQLCRDLGHALAVRRTHPPSHISFDGLAAATHGSAPSSPLVKVDRDREASSFMAEGGWEAKCQERFARGTPQAERPGQGCQDRLLIDPGDGRVQRTLRQPRATATPAPGAEGNESLRRALNPGHSGVETPREFQPLSGTPTICLCKNN